MTEQEKINQQFQRQLDEQNAKFDKAMLKIDMALDEIRQQREDMRRLWERQDEERRKHDADMKELQKRQEAMQAKIDADMKASQAKHDAEMHEMNERFYNKIDENFKTLSNQIHANFIQTMLGFGAIAAAVGGLVLAAFK